MKEVRRIVKDFAYDSWQKEIENGFSNMAMIPSELARFYVLHFSSLENDEMVILANKLFNKSWRDKTLSKNENWFEELFYKFSLYRRDRFFSNKVLRLSNTALKKIIDGVFKGDFEPLKDCGYAHRAIHKIYPKYVIELDFGTLKRGHKIDLIIGDEFTIDIDSLIGIRLGNWDLVLKNNTNETQESLSHCSLLINNLIDEIENHDISQS